MSTVLALQNAIDTVTSATEADRNKNYVEALKLYEKGSDYFLQAIEYEAQTDKQKEVMISKLITYLDRAEILRDFLNSQEKNESEEDENERDKKRLKDKISETIITVTPNVSWEDIAGLDCAKKTLKEVIMLPIQFPQLFTGKRKPSKGVLLFGPAGTGKSYLAKAVAKEAKNSTFFSVSPSDLISKWLGESEKLLKSLFAMARANAPAIIFLDQIESIFSSRCDNESEVSRRIRAEFLIEMEGIGKDFDGILILATTNNPWELHAAIRNCFEICIHIPMPDKTAREQMFKLHIGDTPNSLTEKDFSVLAEKTEGYSGADINVLVRDALMYPVRKCQTATHFRNISDASKNSQSTTDHEIFIPCLPGDKGATRMIYTNIPPHKLKELPICMMKNDFQQALVNSKRTVSKEDSIVH